MPLLRSPVALLSLLPLVACSSSGGGAKDADELPEVFEADIAILSAFVGPGMASPSGDGETWDGFGSVSAEVFTALASLYNPTLGEVVDVLADELDYYDAPDPFGEASLNVGDGYDDEVDLIPEDEDVYEVAWDGPPTFEAVELDGDTRIRVKLWDEDISEHDTIGTAVVEEEDLREAYVQGDVYDVWVGEQTDMQLLFVSVEVY